MRKPSKKSERASSCNKIKRTSTHCKLKKKEKTF